MCGNVLCLVVVETMIMSAFTKVALLNLLTDSIEA